MHDEQKSPSPVHPDDGVAIFFVSRSIDNRQEGIECLNAFLEPVLDEAMQTPQTRHRTIVVAKAHFSQRLREAESGSSVVLTRHGRPVAALVSIDLLAQLERLQSAGPEAGLYGAAGGWEGSEEVAERAVEYGRSTGRETPDLD